MRSDLLIQTLIQNTGKRSGREIAACLLIVLYFGWQLPHLAARSLRQYGCIVLLVTAVLIATVIWRFTLSKKLLREHPSDDTVFWSQIFRQQARLLRLVPLWYLTPLSVGIVLFSFPVSSKQMTGFYGNLAVVMLLFGFLAWINRTAAMGLERQRLQITSP